MGGFESGHLMENSVKIFFTPSEYPFERGVENKEFFSVLHVPVPPSLIVKVYSLYTKLAEVMAAQLLLVMPAVAY